jgi:predicted O-linked N-acetylglucosamine transferase (SPINDLY family)
VGGHLDFAALTALRAKFEQAQALHQSGRLSEAQRLYEAILETLPDSFQALQALGLIAGQRGNPRKAIEYLGKAVAGDPGNKLAYVAYMNMGRAAIELGDLANALESYDRAIAANPGYAEAHCGRAQVQASLHDTGAALASYDRAIEIKPDHADAYFNRGELRRERGEFAAAIEDYDRALRRNPRLKFAQGVRLHARMQIASWDGLAEEIAELCGLVARNEPAASPFYVLAVSDSARTQQQCAQLRVREKCPPNPALGQIAKRPAHGRLKIGYFSADFHDHATMRLLAGVLERHDAAHFDVTLFSYGPDSQDAMRQRVRAACGNFIDVRGLPDLEVARLARKRQIDIAVDLKGYTRDGRGGIFALRAAPVQVSFLGYPGTTGAAYMDYLIADRTVIPEQSRSHYSEKIIRLPDCYQPNDESRPMANEPATRENCGLPPSAFVYCCFNNTYKITPTVFDAWMRILRRVDSGILWLLEDNPVATRNLRQEAVRRGVPAERLVFAPRMNPAEHLARQRLADLFLDTFPCNAHTTASDALWAGLPVLTLAGEAFASRVAASLLCSVGLPELITATLLEYETLAIEFGTNRVRLEAFRTRLAQHRLAGPLFDAGRFTGHLERAYRWIYERRLANLPPEHLDL